MKSLLTMFIMFFVNTAMHGQRMLPRQKALEINSGLLLKKSSGDYFLNIGLLIFSRKGNYKIYTAEYSRITIPYKATKINIESYTVEVGYSFNLLGNPTKSLMFNTTLSAVGGYEYINTGNELLYDGAKLLDKSSFIYGASTKLNIETYVSDRITVTASGRIKLLFNTSQDHAQISMGIGIRFNL